MLDGAEDERYAMWAFVARADQAHADLVGAHGADLQALVTGRAASWHPALRRLIRETDPDTVERFPFTAARRPTTWPQEPVTLLGDAVHVMPPVGGLGGNAALRDAALLARTLAAIGRGEAELRSGLADYQARMLDNGFAAQREALFYTRLATNRSRAVRGVARTFFRFCGAVPPMRKAIFESD
jgi:2-polyprenyl-6-methoxyphenol hydroxylase-like FAD-dependent oxidoreductase